MQALCTQRADAPFQLKPFETDIPYLTNAEPPRHFRF